MIRSSHDYRAVSHNARLVNETHTRATACLLRWCIRILAFAPWTPNGRQLRNQRIPSPYPRTYQGILLARAVADQTISRQRGPVLRTNLALASLTLILGLARSSLKR